MPTVSELYTVEQQGRKSLAVAVRQIIRSYLLRR